MKLMIPHRFFVFGLMMLLVFWPSACEAPPATPTPTPPGLSASAIVTRAAEKLQEVSSFHFDLDHIGGGTPLEGGIEMNKAVGDVVRPDRLKVKLNAAIGGIIVELEAISVGDTTYMTIPISGKFEALPSGINPMAFFDPATGVRAILTSITDLAKLGDETVEGVAVYHLTGKLNAGALKAIAGGTVTDSIVNVEVWVGKDDFLVRQVKVMGQVTKAEKAGLSRTLKLSNYNQPVTIEPPR